MMIRLAIRGFLHREQKFEQRVELPEEQLSELLPKLGAAHAHAMNRGELTMIEIEFLDDPDREQAFFRIGVDPAGMVMPIEIIL